ncbi:MAG: ATPase, partial [Pseudomonadales bacterium]|nr:ATPase [Pseudomonadales bacterium]
QMVLRFEQQADIKVLDSWVYDHFTDNPRMRMLDAGQSFAGLDHDALCALVFDLHNDALDLYRYLQGRAETAGGRELMQDLLAMEEHETLRLAEQTQRAQDL